MTTMNLDEARQTAIQAAEAVQAIPVPFRTGLPKFFDALALAASLGPALDELERARAAVQATIDGVQAAEAQRQAAADEAFAKAQGERLRIVTDLNRQIETQRVALADLAKTLDEAKATIEKAAQLRADVRQRAGSL